jgi:hypothetical protein
MSDDHECRDDGDYSGDEEECDHFGFDGGDQILKNKDLRTCIKAAGEGQEANYFPFAIFDFPFSIERQWNS